jgi:hypothetical protein
VKGRYISSAFILNLNRIFVKLFVGPKFIANFCPRRPETFLLKGIFDGWFFSCPFVAKIRRRILVAQLIENYPFFI